MERETKVLAVIWALFGALIFPFFIVLIGKIVILKGNMEIINGTDVFFNILICIFFMLITLFFTEVGKHEKKQKKVK